MPGKSEPRSPKIEPNAIRFPYDAIWWHFAQQGMPFTEAHYRTEEAEARWLKRKSS